MALHVSESMNEDDFRLLYDTYNNRVYGYVLTIIHQPSAAEDITQEIFIKLWDNRNTLGSVANMEHYIFKMARNRTLNYIRKAAHNKRFMNELKGRMVSVGNNVEEQMMMQDYESMVEEALGQLSPRRHQVYELSRLQGMKLDEIAQKMNLSRNTVKNHLVAALHFIRTYLTDRGVTLLLLLSYFLK